MGAIRNVWNLFRRRRLDDDLRHELDTHFALIEEEESRAGHTIDEARREARLRFGNPRAYRELALEGVIARRLDHVGQDLRQALRMLRRNPGFTLAAVLSVTLGIGANTAMFSVINAVLVRPLPYLQPSRLVAITRYKIAGSLTIPEYDVLRAQPAIFSSVGAYRGAGEARLDWGAGHEWIQTMSVSANLLPTLGIEPALGRTFQAAETTPGGPGAVIVSDRVWRRDLNADPTVLGRVMTIDDASVVIVGVLPAQFWLPQPVDALVPLRPTGSPSDLGANTDVVARLPDSIDVDRAQAAVTTLTERLREADGASRRFQPLVVHSMHNALVGDVSANLLLLFGATGLLLLLGCVNVTMLLMSRIAARGKEIAVRIALGSGAGRLFEQFLLENLVLAALGCAASVASAYWLVSVLVAWIPFDLPSSTPIRVDRTVLAFAVALAVMTALLLTIVPVLAARRVDAQRALKSVGRGAGEQAIRRRTRNLLVIAEVGLSTMLLVGAGLLVHSLYRLMDQRLGFNPAGLTTFVTPLERYRSGVARSTFIRTVAERLRGMPGVRGVAATDVLPLAGFGNFPTQRAGHPDQSIGAMEIRTVTPDYFQVLGTPLLGGRAFSANDTTSTPTVAIVNQTVEREWWPTGHAVGDQLIIGMFRGRRWGNDSPRQVVGLVADAKDGSLGDDPSPTVFIPMDQPAGDERSITWVVRTDDTSRFVNNLRSIIANVDPGQRILRVRTMDDVVSATTATSRFNASLFLILAGVAMALAVIGLYGVLSFIVAMRRQEVGIRVALGADRAQVFGIFLRQGLALTITGLMAGFGGAFLLARFLSTLLYQVRPADPASFGAVALVFLLVGAAASYLPARRAAGLDPAAVLRSD